MDVLGHAGLTLGTVYTAGYILDFLSPQEFRNSPPGKRSLRNLLSIWRSWPRSVQRLGIDLRLVILGALLPDMLDKPLGFWVRPEFVNENLRTVGHSLAFNLTIVAIAIVILVLIRTRSPLVLALASTGHLLLDQTWQQPEKLLWPFFGWIFPRGATTLEEWLSFQLSGGWLGGEELLGAAFLIWFAVHLFQHRVFWSFLKSGELSGKT